MTIKTAIEHLDKNATDEVFWLGPVDLEQIDILENNLGIKLPLDFKEFLPVSYTHLTLPTTPYV